MKKIIITAVITAAVIVGAGFGVSTYLEQQRYDRMFEVEDMVAAKIEKNLKDQNELSEFGLNPMIFSAESCKARVIYFSRLSEPEQEAYYGNMRLDCSSRIPLKNNNAVTVEANVFALVTGPNDVEYEIISGPKLVK